MVHIEDGKVRFGFDHAFDIMYQYIIETSTTVHMHARLSPLLRHQPSRGEKARVTHRRPPSNA